MANYGHIKSFAYLIGAMSFAAPIAMARMQVKTLGMSRSNREDYLQKNLTVANLTLATMSYASAASVAPDIFGVGNSFVGGWAGAAPGDSIGLHGQGSGGGVGNIVPALGAATTSTRGSTATRTS